MLILKPLCVDANRKLLIALLLPMVYVYAFAAIHSEVINTYLKV